MAQKFRFDGWVKSATGAAVPGSQVYICSQPANVDSAPPSPLATVYEDVSGLVPITQPMLTDGFGHYECYAAAGRYTIVVALGGVIQNFYEDQVPMGANSGGDDSVPALKTNGVLNSSQDVLDLLNGAGVTLVSGSNGQVTVNSSGGGSGTFSVVYSTGPTTIPVVPSSNLFSHNFAVPATGVYRINAVADGGPTGGASTGIFGPPANTLVCNGSTSIGISLDTDISSNVTLTITFTNAQGSGLLTAGPILPADTDVIFALSIERLT